VAAHFEFRLQTVQTLRVRERDAAQEAYRQAQLAISKLEEEVESLLAEHASQQPVQAGSSQGMVNAQRLLESQRYQMHLMQEVGQLRQKIEMVTVECEKRRQNLVRREQAVRSLEKLEEKQRDAWEADQQRHAQIVLDEWSGFQYWSRRD